MHFSKQLALFWFLSLGVTIAYGQGKTVSKNSKDTTALAKVDSLKAAIVTATMRPHMRGDTLEYNTEHIRLRANAAVEDLLRRLPGLQIDADGTITYNGEKIEHLLVDGEDIFASSPTMVTQNFDAGKIARVQIMDRKSDQAQFTGMDDGTRVKTLNLVLKDDARNGYFGKAEAGGGPDQYYKADGYMAGFRSKEQFTAIGLASNTGVLSFNSNGSGNSPGVNFVASLQDPMGASAGMGVPHFDAIALHYANAWVGGDQHFLANYQYFHFFSEPVTTTFTLQAQPDSVYGQNQQSRSINRQDQHWTYGSYNWTAGKFSSFRITFHGGTASGQNYYVNSGSSSFNDTLVNSSSRVISDNVSQQKFGGDVGWRVQTGNKRDRAFSVLMAIDQNNTTTNGSIYALNQFFQPNSLPQSTDTVDQQKQIADRGLYLGSLINFTQPIWKNGMLSLGYIISANLGHPFQATYARGDGKYTELVDSLSSNYQARTVNQRATVNFLGKFGGIRYILGTDLIDYQYQQKDLARDSLLKMHSINWAPRGMLTYTPNASTNFNFSYNASSQQPSVSQLAPIQNNNDPLHISIGNPNLKPGLNQNFRLEFRSLKAWMINAVVSMVTSTNGISTRTTTDSLGRQISEPVNVDGGRMINSSLLINKKLSGIDLGFHVNGSYARAVNYVNSDLSQNNSYTGGGGINVGKYVADKYSFQLTTNFIYFKETSSVDAAAPVRYWSQSHQGTLTIFLFRGFEINTNATYTWQERTSAFSTSTSVLLWNAYLSHNFGHDKWVAKLQFNNILDANAGIKRTNANNVNTETTTNILGRYWMLTLAYHFDKKFKKK